MYPATENSYNWFLHLAVDLPAVCAGHLWGWSGDDSGISLQCGYRPPSQSHLPANSYHGNKTCYYSTITTIQRIHKVISFKMKRNFKWRLKKVTGDIKTNLNWNGNEGLFEKLKNWKEKVHDYYTKQDGLSHAQMHNTRQLAYIQCNKDNSSDRGQIWMQTESR